MKGTIFPLGSVEADTSIHRLAATLAMLLLLLAPEMRGGQERDRASRVWDEAITAKGGRERLERVTSFAIRETTVFARATLPEMATGRLVQVVCKPPAGWWEFVDYRPGRMGYSVRVLDAATGHGWATHGGPAASLRNPDTFVGYRIQQLQYLYFLHTQWVQPVPQGVATVQMESRLVHRLEARVEGNVVVFFLDAVTRLPVRVEATRRVQLNPPRPGVVVPTEQKFVYDLDAYHAVDGIQMPRRITIGGDPSEVVVEVNPAIDTSIFSAPPSPAATVDSWRRPVRPGP